MCMRGGGGGDGGGGGGGITELLHLHAGMQNRVSVVE